MRAGARTRCCSDHVHTFQLSMLSSFVAFKANIFIRPTRNIVDTELFNSIFIFGAFTEQYLNERKELNCIGSTSHIRSSLIHIQLCCVYVRIIMTVALPARASCGAALPVPPPPC